MSEHITHYEVVRAHHITITRLNSYTYQDYTLAGYAYEDEKPHRREIIMLVEHYLKRVHGKWTERSRIINRKYHPDHPKAELNTSPQLG